MMLLFLLPLVAGATREFDVDRVPAVSDLCSSDSADFATCGPGAAEDAESALLQIPTSATARPPKSTTARPNNKQHLSHTTTAPAQHLSHTTTAPAVTPQPHHAAADAESTKNGSNHALQILKDGEAVNILDGLYAQQKLEQAKVISEDREVKNQEGLDAVHEEFANLERKAMAIKSQAASEIERQTREAGHVIENLALEAQALQFKGAAAEIKTAVRLQSMAEAATMLKKAAEETSAEQIDGLPKEVADDIAEKISEDVRKEVDAKIHKEFSKANAEAARITKALSSDAESYAAKAAESAEAISHVAIKGAVAQSGAILRRAAEDSMKKMRTMARASMDALDAAKAEAEQTKLATNEDSIAETKDIEGAAEKVEQTAQKAIKKADGREEEVLQDIEKGGDEESLHNATVRIETSSRHARHDEEKAIEKVRDAYNRAAADADTEDFVSGQQHPRHTQRTRSSRNRTAHAK